MTVISGGGAERRKFVEEELRHFEDDAFSSWIGTDREDVSAISPRDANETSSVVHAVDEGVSGLIRSAAQFRCVLMHQLA